MKYYITISSFFPTPTSFRGPYVYDQVRAIERNSDLRVVVFKPKAPWENKADYTYEGVDVHYFNAITMPSLILNGMANGINARSFIKKVKELGINIDDIVVAHGHTSTFAAYALALKKMNPKIKAVVQHHCLDPFSIRNGKFARKRWNSIYRANKNIKLFEKVDLHICISEFVKDALLSFPNEPENLYYDDYRNALAVLKDVQKPNIKDVYVLYNGVDCGKFKPAGTKVQHDLFTIGCIGNFQDLKDQMTLLKALNTLVEKGESHIKVVFIGSGPTMDECVQYINSNNLNDFVEIRSEVHHSELPNFYNEIDLFVLPTYFEGFGCVFTEAAACGVPFMICKHQGATEYILDEESDRWTFEPHDNMTLARLIQDYKTKRYEQHYKFSYDIDKLILDYCKYLSITN